MQDLPRNGAGANHSNESCSSQL